MFNCADASRDYDQSIIERDEEIISREERIACASKFFTQDPFSVSRANERMRSSRMRARERASRVKDVKRRFDLSYARG